MAEFTLTLTDEERAANSWLDFDDASLGKAVKAGCLALLLDKDGRKQERVMFVTCAQFLCNLVAESNSDHSVFTLEGLTKAGEPQGDWELTIRRLK